MLRGTGRIEKYNKNVEKCYDGNCIFISCILFHRAKSFNKDKINKLCTEGVNNIKKENVKM